MRETSNRPENGALKTLKWVAFAASVGLFVRALWGADLSRAWLEIRGIGPAGLLIGVPYLVAVSLDVLGWKIVFSAIGRSVPFGKLLYVRLSVEAVLMSLPGGALVAETMNPYLLRERAGVPLSEGFASIGAKKGLFSLAHGLYILTGGAIGFTALSAISRPMLGSGALPWLIFGAGVFAVVASAATLGLLLFGGVAQRFHGALAGLPVARLRTYLEERSHGFQETDRILGRLRTSGRTKASSSVVLFTLSWLVESVETFLILRLLGVDLSLPQIMSFEAAVSLLRSLAFFVPSGLGVQDVSYMAFLRAFGIPDPITTGAAFVLLKRAKEVFWIAVGYALLLASGERPGHLTLRSEIS